MTDKSIYSTNFLESEWRLLLTSPAEGAWNMALDESILEHSAAGITPPTLRLYSWQPGCLSLGFSQPASNVNHDALSQNGWHCVRRPTGGQAVLHIDELTYSVMAPNTEPRMSGSVLEVYRRISLGLLQALRSLGLEPAADSVYENTIAKSDNPVCFENPSNYEITVSGLKLIGSAQARKAEGILQHGSIPIHGDITRILKCFLKIRDLQRARDKLLQHAANLELILGETLPYKQVEQAVINGFSSALNLRLVQAEPTHSEILRAEELMRDKYLSDKWMNRI